MRTMTNLALLTLSAWMLLMLVGCSAYPDRTVKVSPTTTGTVAPAKKARSLTVADVEITLKVKEKQCFGDAGCNVTVEPVVTLLKDPGDDQVYEITFKVYGDESGPVTETITLTGDQASSIEIFLGTPKPSTKITAKVTDVEKWAY